MTLSNQARNSTTFNMCHQPSPFWLMAIDLINGPVLVTLVVISITANCLSIVTLRKLRVWRQVRIYTIFLAFWDILIAIGSLPMIGIPNILIMFTGWNMHNASYISLVIMVVGYVVCNCALVGAIWSSMAFAIDRFCALCYPMFHRRWTSRHRRIAVVAIIFGVVLVNIPRLIVVEIITLPDGSHAIASRKFRFPEILVMCRAVISVLFISGIPTLILLGLGVCISIKLHTHNNAIQQSIRVAEKRKSDDEGVEPPPVTRGTRRQSNVRTNVVSLSIVINSVIFHSIPVFIDIHEALVKFHLSEPYRLCAHQINLLTDVGNFLVVLNTICCIVVYLCDRRFRTVFVNVLMCRKRRVVQRNWNTNDDVTLRLVQRKKPVLYGIK